MKRIVVVAAVLAGIHLASPIQARATEGSWCALLNFGSDLTEDCQYRSIEECRQTIIAGIRGFCNPNPRWQGEVVKSRPRRKS